MDSSKTDLSKQSFNAPEIKLHFLDYWRIIRIRKTVILAVFLLVALTTTLVTFILPERYSSTVRIQVEKEAPDVAALTTQPMAGMMYDPYWIQTEFEKIGSKKVMYKVIEKLNLNREWAKKYKESGDLRTELTYMILKSDLDIRQARNTSLIEISVRSEKPGEAALIANTIADVYRDVRIKNRQEVTERGIAVLREQYDNQSMAVSNKQAEVNGLKDKLAISDSEAASPYQTSTMEPETLRRIEASRLEAQARLASIRTAYDKMTNLSPDELKQTINVVYPDTQLEELLRNEKEAEQKLAALKATLGANNLQLQEANNLYETVTNQVSKRLRGVMTGLKNKVDAMQAEVNELITQVESAKTNDIKKSIERRPYFMAKRDLETLQLLRDKLQMQIIAQEIDSKIPKSMIVEVVDQAEPGLRPVKPNKTMNISLGIIVGLLIGVGLAFFIEYLDTSVKTIDDVERALQAPVLGVIPQNVGLLHEEGPDSPHAEAYRVLRTNVLFSRKDPKLNTITVISGGAGEGKSTTLFNLAIVFAQNGQRVLIVDSDLRRPSIHKFFRVNNTVGLTSFLMRQNSLEESIQTTSIPTLDFMPSGKLPSSSLGILSSAQMKEMVRDLKRRYDFVFFDSPPIMGVSDASILASEVDMVLQVIQYRRYPQPMTIRAKQMVEKVGGNLLGIVLNNINMAQDENYYYYSGYYYDYYSRSYDEYEYSSKESKSGDKSAADEKLELKSKY
ncbi:MAG: polysaccharide biosynthesis tyrosine autokinase [Verrucomicrobia bacterium]|nr:polysaccharide biosynthesis tyrosine autokinase [Verrucomicrobiota bacterium]